MGTLWTFKTIRQCVKNCSEGVNKFSKKIGGDADFLKPHWDSLNHIETRLEFLRGGSSCKGKGHGGILELQRYFFHNPPRDKSFAVGRILGYVAIFAKRCAGMM